MAEVLFIIYGLKQLVDLGAHLPRGFFSGADPGFPKGGGCQPLNLEQKSILGKILPETA